MKRILIAVSLLLPVILHTQRNENIKVSGITSTLPQGGHVTLYDLPNFQGNSKSFGMSTFRLVSEAGLNDRTSSIKVPPGMGVIIYADANEKGGSGDYVDLLEDCGDLSVYYFNNKVSYINVFSIEKAGGYVWARARMVNNQFVPGHWERKRASGKLPDNSPPAVAYMRHRPLPPVQSNLPL